ncbi:MAG: AzlC family ABC transporter permease [Clostridia bacterium]|nr:AzlC family ABC transporter permease [Clostridia bacterium]
MKQDIKRAFKDSLPVLAGYIVLGMGFGILLATKGYGVWWALAMSVFIYAGSMQYLAIDLLAGGASLLSAALTTLLVNARHLFYGISMVDRYKGAGKKKPYLVFALTDETYSLVCSAEESHRYCFLVSLLNQIWWVTGSVLGSLLGGILPFSTEGIDFALTALFVTVFVEQWKSTKNHLPAIIGVVASVLCLLLFGADSFLIPSMVLITAALSVLKFVRKEAQA